MTQRVLYKGYTIYYDPKPIPTDKMDWSWYHQDFDGAPDSNDRRCGASASIEAAILDINDLIEDMDE